jgi:hypothetical protein
MTRELSLLSPIDQLGEDIAVLVSRLHAATYELLVLLQQFDQGAGWNNGFQSCAHWLHWRTGIDLGAAREKVRVAKALPELPLLSAAMQRGAVSYAKVRAITRVATPANEAQLLDVALTATAAQVERVVRAWRRCDRVRAAQQAETRHLNRGLRTCVDDDGMLVVQGRLMPEQGAIFRKALEAAADQLWRESRAAAAPDTVVAEVTPAQRRADALVMVAEAALSGDLDAGTAADRYQVVLHVDAGDVLAPCQTAASEPDAMFEHSAVECGDRLVDVSAETSARLACDASAVVIREDDSGTALNVGRKTRTVPSAIRRALEARDTGCRFPGCTARRCDAHHVTHWAAGGPTSLDNLVLLCRRHHTLLHEGGYSVHPGVRRTFTFVNARGRIVDVAPAAPEWSRTQTPTGRTAAWLSPLPEQANGKPATAPVWDGTPFDVRDVINVLRGHEPLR